MHTTSSTGSTVVISAPSAIDLNDDTEAFKYWHGEINSKFPCQINATFSYSVFSKRNFFDFLFGRRPTEIKKFETEQLQDIVITKKGFQFGVTPKDERDFYGMRNRVRHGFGVPFRLTQGRFISYINVKFSDVISLKIKMD